MLLINFLINAFLVVTGVGGLGASIYLLLFQKKKRKEDWKVIVGAGIYGIIICLALINSIFG